MVVERSGRGEQISHPVAKDLASAWSPGDAYDLGDVASPLNLRVARRIHESR
jgi:hypothetical protein